MKSTFTIAMLLAIGAEARGGRRPSGRAPAPEPEITDEYEDVTRGAFKFDDNDAEGFAQDYLNGMTGSTQGDAATRGSCATDTALETDEGRFAEYAA